MLLPLSLLFVGAVLVLNGLWLSGRISDREVVVINLATAAITAVVALLTMIAASGIGDVRAAALTLLFTLTYLWVAHNRLSGCDGRGLGWFSLFVAISVLPEALRQFIGAKDLMAHWLALSWFAWSGLWFIYFLGLALEWRIPRLTAGATFGAGVVTAWLPALVLLFGPEP